MRRNFNPLIEEQELLVKQYRAEATEKIVGKLAKKMGADKILNEFKRAEAQLKAIREKAQTFFKKKAEQDPTKKGLTYTMRDREEKIELYIPPGPRLGNNVIEAQGVSKSFGDKLLYILGCVLINIQ